MRASWRTAGMTRNCCGVASSGISNTTHRVVLSPGSSREWCGLAPDDRGGFMLLAIRINQLPRRRLKLPLAGFLDLHFDGPELHFGGRFPGYDIHVGSFGDLQDGYLQPVLPCLKRLDLAGGADCQRRMQPRVTRAAIEKRAGSQVGDYEDADRAEAYRSTRGDGRKGGGEVVGPVAGTGVGAQRLLPGRPLAGLKGGPSPLFPSRSLPGQFPDCDSHREHDADHQPARFAQQPQQAKEDQQEHHRKDECGGDAPQRPRGAPCQPVHERSLASYAGSMVAVRPRDSSASR